MRNSVRIWAGIVLLLWGQAFAQGTAATAPRTEQRMRAEATFLPPKILDISSLLRTLSIAGTSVTPWICGSAPDCPVPVEITLESISGGSYCLARLPAEINFPGTAEGNSPKWIVWGLNIDPSIPAGNSFEFQEKHGIILVADAKGQLDKFGRGASEADPSDVKKFHARNMHKKKHDPGVPATYLPVILHKTKNANGEDVVNVCGAVDPRIVND